MEHLDLKIRTIKAKSENEIEHFIDETVAKLRKASHLESELKSYLEEAGIYIKENQEKFLNIILLSCILADVGSQMSPFVRGANSEKIKSICRKRSLNYNQLLDITYCAEEMLKIIGSNIDDN